MREPRHNIKINHNSDCWAEIETLKELLKENVGYIHKDFSAAEVVAIAINELYDKIMTDKRLGLNQRAL